MENAHDGGPVPARFADQIDDHLPVRAVQRGRGLVEQENGGRADEAARDVHPLLLAAGKRGGRDVPQAFGQVQPGKQPFGAAAGGGLPFARLKQRLRDQIQRARGG